MQISTPVFNPLGNFSISVRYDDGQHTPTREQIRHPGRRYLLSSKLPTYMQLCSKHEFTLSY